MNSLKFNETTDYTYMTVFDTEGVITKAYIDHESLPDGFYRYSLQGKNTESIDSISIHQGSDHVGHFITKNPIDLGQSGIKNLNHEDHSLNSQKEFDFSTYFGCHLSIDCQIRLAEEKRDFQIRNDGREHGLNTFKSELNI